MRSRLSRWREAVSGFQLRPRVLMVGIALVVSLIFVGDYLQPNIIALASVYSIPVLTSLWLGQRRFTVAIAVLCAVLAVIGVHDNETGNPNDPVLILLNRIAALFTIGVVAGLGLMRLSIERKLFDTQEAVTTTLRSLAEAVITTDTKGEISFMNPVAEDLTGFALDEAVNKPLAEIFHVVDEHESGTGLALPPIEELEDSAGAVSFEGTLVSKSGKRVPVSEKRAPIRDAEGRVYGHVLVFRDITEQREHEETMRRMAYRDELTGLPNRTSLGDRLSLELAHARRNREMLAVCYMDLDHFKQVNDSLGHHAGDEYLKAIAERLRAVLRAGDTVARVGGDEFVLLLPGIGGVRDASHVAQKVLGALALPLRLEGRDLAAGASLGLALYPQDGDEPDTLLRRADKAMYRAKERGGSHFEFATAAKAPRT